MSPLDTDSLRNVVASFPSRQPQRFQELIQARELIAELRRKGASFDTIAELLTSHGLAVGKTSIAGFCHEVLGEKVRSRRRSPAKKKADRTDVAPQPISTEPSRSTPAEPSVLSTMLPPVDPGVSSPRRARGPRIAHIALADPTDS